MEFLSRPLEESFEKMMKMVHTKRGTAAMMEDLCMGRLHAVIAKTLQLFFSRELQLQLRRSVPYPERTEELLASCLWKFAVALAGALALTSAKYLVPPACFLSLLSADATVRTTCLQDLAIAHRSVETLEQLADDGHPEVSAWLRDMEWPQQVWCRENMSLLSECEFENVYPWLLNELRGYSRAHGTSLLIENLFNAARSVSRKNPRGMLEGRAFWHNVAMADTCCSDFERPHPAITNAARAVSTQRLPAQIFTAPRGQSTLTEEQYESLTDESPSWPNHSAANHKAAALQSLATSAASGDWATLSTVWQSLLLLPGTYCRCELDGRSRLVLASTAFGFLGYRCRTVKKGREVHLDVQAAPENCVVFDYVTDYDQWRCLDVNAKPARHGVGVGPGLSYGGFQLMVQGSGMSLLKHSLRRGLAQFTVYNLKKLYAKLDIPLGAGERKPVTEGPLLEANLSSCLSRGLYCRAAGAGHDCQTQPLDEVSMVEHSLLMEQDSFFWLEEAFDDMDLERELAEAKEKVLKARLRSEQRLQELKVASAGAAVLQQEQKRERARSYSLEYIGLFAG